MSNACHPTATVRGLEGPFYPSALEHIHTLLHPSPVHDVWSVLDRTVLALKGAKFAASLNMADGYKCRCHYAIQHADCIIFIAVPHAKDSSMQNGTFADRHIAVYTSCVMHPDVLNHFIKERFLLAFDFVAGGGEPDDLQIHGAAA